MTPQAGQFIHFYSEKVPTAIDRYTKQVTRVLGVLKGCSDVKHWLVGDKTAHDNMAWVPWNDRADTSSWVPEPDKFQRLLNVKVWHERWTSRPSWKRAMQIRARLMDEQDPMWNGIPKGIRSFSEYEAKIKASDDAATNEFGACSL
ncbi:hypothetical protein JX265_007067 [Neoarthrinium moseri]|uniref:glutathione transferase n=1 Tax=Neoarthrinium moseri TaxID=1658444 RepID=A0A9Q0ANH9_9PEZI|nr:hypothetical protein JX265_007067 [Neoarthrinium moseri]